MVKRLVTFALILSTAIASLHAGELSKDTDTHQKEVTLNKHQLAAIAAVLAEMRRRGDSFRGWQVHITDKGNSYEVAFLEDPLNMAMVGGPGMSWIVRKRDLHLSGPTFYR
jgi:hypothetical protein